MVSGSKISYHALLLFLVLSHNLHACLESIDPALGANPSFFNMSDPVNREIYSQNIPADEKFYLLVHNTFPEAPLLSNIRNYNLLMPFYCPPKDTQVVDKTYIRNAWVRAITIMPSIADEDNVHWALPKGEVMVSHNYSIQVPRSATNVYPDCGIVYTLLNSSAHLSVYANGNYIGDSHLTTYTTNSTNLGIRADLFVSAAVRKDYYVSNCYCCKSGKDGCEETCCSCDFSNTEVDKEQASLNSSLSRRVYSLEALPELTILRCPTEGFGTATGNLSVKNNVPIQSISLSFPQVNLSLQTQKLDIMPVLKPHNVLEAQSAEYDHEFSEGIFVSGFNISKGFIQLNFTGVPQGDVRVANANLMVIDIFGIPHNLSDYTKITCPLNPQIDLIIPHWAEEGSNFQAVFRLSDAGKGIPNKEVKIYYSSEEQTGRTDSQGEARFTLKANYSIVEAKSEYDGKYADVSTVRTLMVYQHSTISFLLSSLAFLFILVLTYIAFRHMSRGVE